MKGLSGILKVTLISALGITLYGMSMFVIFTDFYNRKNIDWLSKSVSYSVSGLIKIERNSIFSQKVSPLSATNQVKAATIKLDEDYVEIQNEMNIKSNTYVNPAVFSSINLRYDSKIHRINSSDIQMMLGHNEYLQDAFIDFESFGERGVRTVVVEMFEPYKYEKKYFQPNEDGILQEKVSGFEYYERDSGPDIDDAVSEVIRVMNSRLNINSGAQDFITVKDFEHKGTNGEYSNDKYIELDQTDQMIRAWEDGELYREWDASGFYDEYAVYGVFDIKNKSDKAWSPIAEKWMPYWMAFYYEEKQAAWFGLHELVYWYDAEGNYIEESSDSIGFKKSGGCVRLDRGEMIELYDWTDVGIHFLIYE